MALAKKCSFFLAKANLHSILSLQLKLETINFFDKLDSCIKSKFNHSFFFDIHWA